MPENAIVSPGISTAKIRHDALLATLKLCRIPARRGWFSWAVQAEDFFLLGLGIRSFLFPFFFMYFSNLGIFFFFFVFFLNKKGKITLRVWLR